MDEEIKCGDTCEYFYMTKSFVSKCKGSKTKKNEEKVIPTKQKTLPLWCPRRKENGL